MKEFRKKCSTAKVRQCTNKIQKWNRYELVEKHFQYRGKWNLFLYHRCFVQFYNECPRTDSGLQTSFVFKHFPANILSRTLRNVLSLGNVHKGCPISGGGSEIKKFEIFLFHPYPGSFSLQLEGKTF